MKIIPKKQKGGSFDSFFTTYVPLSMQKSRTHTYRESEQRTSKSSESSDDSKGKLTERDFFDMLKGINGLPNEMSSIVGNLVSTFQMSNLTGLDPGNLATQYLQNLYQIKVAAQNKDTYDKAVEQASKNGAMAEPAISIDGRILVQNKDGSINAISLDTYNNNRDQYSGRVLTVSNLANLRKYDPSLAYNQGVFDIINNSVGYEAFQELVNKATQSLGSSEVTRNGMFSVEGKASQGLTLLQTLREDDRVQALGSITANGLYEYKIIDKNQLSQINALKNYIVAVLPDRAKTWAAIKTGQNNKDKATGDLILTYLLGKQNTLHSFNIQYNGSIEKAEGSKSSSSSSSGSKDDPKEGFWRQVQSGKGGDDFTYNLLSKTGRMSVDGKFYGTTPGLDNNKSLGDYINDSRVGYLIKNNKNITFGDTKISVNSFNDIMVNSGSGAAVVTLPIKTDGSVDLAVAERWAKVRDALKNSNLREGTPEYNQRQRQLMRENELEGLLDSNGLPNKNRFNQFLVLEGYTSDKANAIQNNKQVSFKDITSDFIVPAGDDDNLYDMVRKGLSNKDRGEYELSNGWFSSNDLFKGNIYIPLNTNPINAYNADENDIKQATSYLYEKATQRNSTSSDLL